MLQTKKHADGKTQSDRILLIQTTVLSRLHLVIDAGQATFEIMSIDMFLVLNRLTMLLQLLLEAKLESLHGSKTQQQNLAFKQTMLLAP